jgi:hypothetical protein
MPSYAWVCFVCEGSNLPALERCSHCGAGAQLTGAQIAVARQARFSATSSSANASTTVWQWVTLAYFVLMIAWVALFDVLPVAVKILGGVVLIPMAFAVVIRGWILFFNGPGQSR